MEVADGEQAGAVEGDQQSSEVMDLVNADQLNSDTLIIEECLVMNLILRSNKSRV